MIPRRIIQTWKNEDIPRPYRGFQRKLKQLHPDYDFALFTDEKIEAFMRQDYPEYCDAYDALPHFISKIDLFRLLAVHKMGGFYLDIDVLVRLPFDDLCEHECIFPFERHADPYFAALHGTVEIIGQYAFGARPGHPFLLACADQIRRAALEPDSLRLPTDAHLACLPSMYGNAHSMEVLNTSGPGLITRTFIESPQSREDVKIIAAVDSRDQKKVKFSFGTHASHQLTGSWLTGISPGKLRTVRLLAKMMHRRNARALAHSSPVLGSHLMMAGHPDPAD